MTRVDKHTRRYAFLDSLKQVPSAPWQAIEDAARGMTDAAFEQHVDALCRTADRVRRQQSGEPAQSGEATRRRIERRVEARNSECLRRTALDLQRLADLEDRMDLRRAQTTRRIWFVLGRLLEKATATDPRWLQAITMLAASGALTKSERVLVERFLGRR